MKTETQVREEIEGRRNLTTERLKQKYCEVFGKVSFSVSQLHNSPAAAA